MALYPRTVELQHEKVPYPRTFTSETEHTRTETVSSTSKARLVHIAATKVFYLFFHLKLGISYFFFQSLYFLCQSLFNDKTRQGWTMETQKHHKNGCYRLIDHCRMPCSNRQMWLWHQHTKELQGLHTDTWTVFSLLATFRISACRSSSTDFIFPSFSWILKKSKETT